MSGLVVSLVAVGALARAAGVPPQHDYVLHCSGCHRADGRGVPDAVPSLVGVDRFLRVSAGRPYLVRAPGVAQAPLADERLARLLNWVVVNFGTSRVSPAYTAHEVGLWRRRPLRDPTSLRERLLSQTEVAGARRPPPTGDGGPVPRSRP